MCDLKLEHLTKHLMFCFLRPEELNSYPSTDDGEWWHGGEDAYSTVYDSLKHHPSKQVGLIKSVSPPPLGCGDWQDEVVYIVSVVISTANPFIQLQA